MNSDHKNLQKEFLALVHSQREVLADRDAVRGDIEDLKNSNKKYTSRLKLWEDASETWEHTCQQIQNMEETIELLRKELSEKSGLLANERDRSARLEVILSNDCQRYEALKRIAENQGSNMNERFTEVLAAFAKPEERIICQNKVEECLDALNNLSEQNGVNSATVQQSLGQIKSFAIQSQENLAESRDVQQDILSTTVRLETHLLAEITQMKGELETTKTLREKLCQGELLSKEVSMKNEVLQTEKVQATKRIIELQTQLTASEIQKQDYDLALARAQELSAENNRLKNHMESQIEISRMKETEQNDKLQIALAENAMTLEQLAEQKKLAQNAESQISQLKDDLALANKKAGEMQLNVEIIEYQKRQTLTLEHENIIQELGRKLSEAQDVFAKHRQMRTELQLKSKLLEADIKRKDCEKQIRQLQNLLQAESGQAEIRKNELAALEKVNEFQFKELDQSLTALSKSETEANGLRLEKHELCERLSLMRSQFMASYDKMKSDNESLKNSISGIQEGKARLDSILRNFKLIREDEVASLESLGRLESSFQALKMSSEYNRRRLCPNPSVRPEFPDGLNTHGESEFRPMTSGKEFTSSAPKQCNFRDSEKPTHAANYYTEPTDSNNKASLKDMFDHSDKNRKKSKKLKFVIKPEETGTVKIPEVSKDSSSSLVNIKTSSQAESSPKSGESISGHDPVSLSKSSSPSLDNSHEDSNSDTQIRSIHLSRSVLKPIIPEISRPLPQKLSKFSKDSNIVAEQNTTLPPRNLAQKTMPLGRPLYYHHKTPHSRDFGGSSLKKKRVRETTIEKAQTCDLEEFLAIPTQTPKDPAVFSRPLRDGNYYGNRASNDTGDLAACRKFNSPGTESCQTPQRPKKHRLSNIENLFLNPKKVKHSNTRTKS
ncbi:MAG: hypothetical protein M1829_002820 [Trizodia sp. TS-e1964]|nr:MAG: hypothetical protein M1829_002820 [Trizodia sp. TS-e1964]